MNGVMMSIKEVALPAAGVVAGLIVLAFAVLGALTFATARRRTFHRLIKIILPLVVLAVAGAGASYFVSTKPEPERKEEKVTAQPVEVEIARLGTERVIVSGMGSVIPAREVEVRPQVTGLVVEQSPRLVRGGRFRAGEIMCRIDPSDYELAVRQAEADVALARSELAVEEGRQVIAEREWELIGPDVSPSDKGRDLALRKPQLASAKARLDAAESRLEEARLNLERTVIRAPFNAVVRTEPVASDLSQQSRRTAAVGQLVSPSTTLCTLMGTDQFWVEVSLPYARLQFVSVPGVGGAREGSPVEVIQVTGQDTAVRHAGRVVRLLSDLDSRSRLARLLVAVDDPLELASGGREPLLEGAFVRAEIEGVEVSEVFVLPRVAVREDGGVWVMDENDRLRICWCEEVWGTSSTVVICNMKDADGPALMDGDRVIVSLISAPVPGMRLREAGDDATTGPAEGATTEPAEAAAPAAPAREEVGR